ncbi:hypothetical protein A9Q83_16980 [Alphaproteobacteria bacterium 46_93_T64]|nr:hypothetical protein A9Q83_16980 [Alphaproteobacteria bacterium 46_93_T64]
MALRQVSGVIFGFICVAILFAADISLTFAADKVAVRAAEHPTYGRLVLDWGRKQTYEAEIRDGFLIINFPTPFEANLRPAEISLGSFVSKGEIYNNNKSIRFKIKENYKLKTAVYGSAIALDLVKIGATTAESTPTVKMRAGDHSKYSRLVVDWPNKTEYKVAQNGDNFALTFDRSAEIALSAVTRDLPRYIKKVSSSQKSGKTTIIVEANGHAKVKAFRSGNSTVFDFSPDASTKLTEKPETQEAASTPKKVKKASIPIKKITHSPPVPEKPAVVTEKVNAENGREVASIKKTTDAHNAPEAKHVEEAKPRSLIPVKVAARSEKSARSVSPPSEKLVLDVGNLRDGFRLIFPWKQSAAMALFERAGNYWIVFDKRVQLDFRNLSGPYKFLVIRKKQIGHPTATITRLAVRDGYAPSVTRTGNEWRVDFRLGEVPVIKNTIDIQPQPAAQEGARIFIPAVNNGNKISFKDPQAGDELIAIPLFNPSWGIGRSRTFTQFTILPSMQGIAMTPRDSSVEVAVERNGVSITAQGGLQLTRAISKADLFASGDQTDRFTGKKDKAQLVKLDQWAQVSEKEFIERKQLLQRKVARAPRAGRNALRMELAKFFVAHKYHADAFAVLERVRLDDPRADEDGLYRLLRGLSNLGKHHLVEAEVDLFNPVFSGIAEVAPWRGKLAAEKGDWKLAGEEFKIGSDAFGVYNSDLNNEFNLLQAEAALEDYDVELATSSLEKIKTSLEQGTNPTVAARREYLEGIAAMRSGDIDRAIGKFDQAIALDVRPVAALAQYEKINAELAQKLITPEEAVDAFQKMSFAWRGDDLELNILKRIGDLHIASGKIREGMQSFRNIVMTFPKSRLARDIAREMNDLFSQLFIEGEAEKMSPIKALALYYEYRELTPLGDKGDKMIRNLADRLIKVDLLEQAAQLLDHQVNFRLKGELKALTGTKLAVIHLWDENPKESLAILYKTRWRALPDKVKKERLYIQARANADLSNFDEALSLLEDDKSKTADLLRADIYWKAKQWPKAIKALETLMKESGADKAAKLEPLDRQRLMQVAVARSLVNDQDGISAMRKKYRKKLVDTPDLDAFDLITDNTDGSEINFRERSTAIAKISQLESFMSGYREQLKNGDFWSTN